MSPEMKEIMRGAMESNRLQVIGRKVEENWDNLSIRFNGLREIYKDGPTDDPYMVNWIFVFTPIEFQLWQDIRGNGLDFFPQYPVGRFFADFADPKRKIIIEADGKRWHDPVKDAARDLKTNAMGWETWRYTGAECYKEDVLDQLIESRYQ